MRSRRAALPTATWRFVRMREEGIRIVTREMVAFEWLAVAGTPLFGEINREFFK